MRVGPVFGDQIDARDCAKQRDSSAFLSSRVSHLPPLSSPDPNPQTTHGQRIPPLSRVIVFEIWHLPPRWPRGLLYVTLFIVYRRFVTPSRFHLFPRRLEWGESAPTLSLLLTWSSRDFLGWIKFHARCESDVWALHCLPNYHPCLVSQPRAI